MDTLKEVSTERLKGELAIRENQQPEYSFQFRRRYWQKYFLTAIELRYNPEAGQKALRQLEFWKFLQVSQSCTSQELKEYNTGGFDDNFWEHGFWKSQDLLKVRQTWGEPCRALQRHRYAGEFLLDLGAQIGMATQGYQTPSKKRRIDNPTSQRQRNSSSTPTDTASNSEVTQALASDTAIPEQGLGRRPPNIRNSLPATQLYSSESLSQSSTYQPTRTTNASPSISTLPTEPLHAEPVPACQLPSLPPRIASSVPTTSQTTNLMISPNHPSLIRSHQLPAIGNTTGPQQFAPSNPTYSISSPSLDSNEITSSRPPPTSLAYSNTPSQVHYSQTSRPTKQAKQRTEDSLQASCTRNSKPRKQHRGLTEEEFVAAFGHREPMSSFYNIIRSFEILRIDLESFGDGNMLLAIVVKDKWEELEDCVKRLICGSKATIDKRIQLEWTIM
ncbi:hypothetical protein MKZ38_009262 [Zalerion maritima]|uniref:Uncharacterized protein n=1 Tax=Zalerion maritima TaxID=339359 RepID=A0AAD5WYH4_9PEZI|nr:hypothetical protein MKZ38_009262 [Zalerion maritima]